MADTRGHTTPPRRTRGQRRSASGHAPFSSQNPAQEIPLPRPPLFTFAVDVSVISDNEKWQNVIHLGDDRRNSDGIIEGKAKKTTILIIYQTQKKVGNKRCFRPKMVVCSFNYQSTMTFQLCLSSASPSWIARRCS